MEKFALLDFLKAFESLTANRSTEKEQAAPPAPPPPSPATPSALPANYERNVMADVIARHEEIANRIRNKK